MKTPGMLICQTCGKSTVHLIERPNHVLHLLLTVFTFGVWIIVWLLVGLSERRATCTVCGTRYARRLFESV